MDPVSAARGGHDGEVRIRALSVFEGVVYHCWPVDRSDPERPTLEVDALLRAGDADAEAGPLLVTVSDYGAMVGDPALARRCIDDLRRKGRIVDFLGVEHLSFPTWTQVVDDAEPHDVVGTDHHESTDDAPADGTTTSGAAGEATGHEAPEPAPRPVLRLVDPGPADDSDRPAG